MFPSPIHILPSGKLGTSLALIVEETVTDPAFPPETLPIKPIACILFNEVVGFTVVNPPPDFTKILSPTVGVTPSIGDVVKFNNSPIITTKPKALFVKVSCSNPIAGPLFAEIKASASAISITAVAPTLPVW